MFSAIREGQLFYILEKGENITLKKGVVQGVSQPYPRFNTSFGGNDMIVDITVKTGDELAKFEKLPANLSIANSGNVIVSDSREAMSAEVEGMKRQSEDALNAIPYHEKTLTACDWMLRELNPQFAKEREQEEKIGRLEEKVGGMETTLTDIREMLTIALNANQKKENYEDNRNHGKKERKDE